MPRGAATHRDGAPVAQPRVVSTSAQRGDDGSDVSDEIKTLSEQDDGAKRLMTVPGIGPIISTATVAAIGSGDVFSKGRDFGAWLDSCRDKCRRAGAQSSGPSPSVAIAICGYCSFRQLVPYYCARRAGRSMASNPGSRLQPGDSVASS
jgi:Transposase IS116/IS110/IS902 family